MSARFQPEPDPAASLLGAGTPRELKNRAVSLVLRLFLWIACPFLPEARWNWDWLPQPLLPQPIAPSNYTHGHTEIRPIAPRAARHRCYVAPDSRCTCKALVGHSFCGNGSVSERSGSACGSGGDLDGEHRKRKVDGCPQFTPRERISTRAGSCQPLKVRYFLFASGLLGRWRDQ